MAYLNLDANYFDHVKTKRLVAKLGYGSDSIPLKLWCYCAQHYPDTGVIPNHTAEEIASLIGYQGDAQAMLQALLDLEIAFLTSKNGIGIHEWNEHQGHIVSFHLRAKVANKARWDKYYSRRHPATSIAKEETSIATRNPPNLTKPNHTFIKPSIEQINCYCKEHGYDINANTFFDHYETRGWMIGKNKIKNWQACIRTWVNRDKNKLSESTIDDITKGLL